MNHWYQVTCYRELRERHSIIYRNRWKVQGRKKGIKMTVNIVFLLKFISFLLSLVKYVSFIFLYMKNICMFMYTVDYKWMLKLFTTGHRPRQAYTFTYCTLSVCLFYYYHSAWLIDWLSDILHLAETKSTEPYTIFLWHILHFFHYLQEIIQCTAKTKYTDGKFVCVNKKWYGSERQLRFLVSHLIVPLIHP